MNLTEKTREFLKERSLLLLGLAILGVWIPIRQKVTEFLLLDPSQAISGLGWMLVILLLLCIGLGVVYCRVCKMV